MTDACSSYSPFVSLITNNPDALLAVLCRVPAKDHNSLRLTCQTIRAALDSEPFRRERSLTGWAETHVTLLTKEELYRRDSPSKFEKEGYNEQSLQEDYGEFGRRDSSYGYHDVEASIWVDGKLGGEVSLVLVPPEIASRGSFHEATEAHSCGLQDVGWAYCDNRGRPRLESVKRHYRGGEGFLWIHVFDIRPEYRDSTNVGAAAVRSLLCGTRLVGNWGLAVYMADAMDRLADEDHKRISLLLGPNLDDTIRESETEKHRTRWKELSKFDARPFMRTGFQQATELIADADYPYQFFAVPSFLESMISHDEALSLAIVGRQALPKEPTGANRELLELVTDACIKRRNQQKISVRSPNVQARLQQFQQRKENEIDAMAKTAILKRLRRRNIEASMHEELSHRIMEAKQPQIQRIKRQAMERARSRIRKMENAARQEIDRIDSRVRNEASRLIREKGATIEESHVLHFCAACRVAEYIDLLLDLVLPAKREGVVNGLDENGNTPLMCAVSDIGSEVDERQKAYVCCEKFIDAGADKNVSNPLAGKTALGYFRTSVRQSRDIRNAFSLPARTTSETSRIQEQQMERLLMPFAGATHADDAVLDGEASDEESDDNDDFIDMPDDDFGGNDEDDE